MKVGVVGLGLIGGSLALDLKASGYASEVWGTDTSSDHAEQALKLSLVTRVTPLSELLAGVDLVVLSVPVDAIARLLVSVLDQVRPHTTVIDMGSTKDLICKSVVGHLNRKQFVAAHPMAGTEHSGPQAAIARLFEGRAAVICDREQSGKEHLKRAEELFAALKMRTIFMSSKDHDLHAAYVSHLSHISSFVLANAVLEKEKNANAIFDLASGGFESTVRLAKSSPEMWKPIFEQNSHNVIEALGVYIDHLTKFKESMETGQYEKTRSFMKKANEIKRVLKEMPK